MCETLSANSAAERMICWPAVRIKHNSRWIAVKLMPFTVKIQWIATATDWIGGISQPEEVPVSVAVGIGAQPDKAVSRGVLRDGHVEQLHLVHLAGHVAFLQQTNKNKKMMVGKCGSWKRARPIDFFFCAQCNVLSVVSPGCLAGWTPVPCSLCRTCSLFAKNKQTNKKQNKNEGGKMWVLEKKEAYRF